MLRIKIEPMESSYNGLYVNLVPDDYSQMKMIKDNLSDIEVENPSVQFAKSTKNGVYVDMPDEYFGAALYFMATQDSDSYNHAPFVNIMELFARSLQSALLSADYMKCECPRSVSEKYIDSNHTFCDYTDRFRDDYTRIMTEANNFVQSLNDDGVLTVEEKRRLEEYRTDINAIYLGEVCFGNKESEFCHTAKRLYDILDSMLKCCTTPDETSSDIQ